MNMRDFAVFLIAFFIVLKMIPFLKRWGLEQDIIDCPDERKIHHCKIPRLGGIAINMGFLFSVLFLGGVTPMVRGVLAGGLVIFWVGVVDDLHGLSARQKFFGQIVGAVLAVSVGGLTINHLGDVFGFGEIVLPVWFGVPFTVFAIVGVINAINLLDGLDGLAAGVSLIAAISFLLLAFLIGNGPAVMLCAALIGSLLGFLRFNFYPAQIFMGDSGSLTIGYMLACLAIMLTQPGAGKIAISPATPVLILGLPILDTLWVMARRLRLRTNPFHPDKTHLHHKLLRLGFAHRTTVLILYFLGIFWSISAFALMKSPEYLALGFFCVVCCLKYGGLYYLKIHSRNGMLTDDENREFVKGR
jgi:UDP-GlcNAc:undecaprenyl-phosphate GlcNAc-1-phosphate transferase